MNQNITVNVATPAVVAKNGLATAGFVLALIGFLLAGIPLIGLFLALPLAILGLVFGAVGIGKAGKVKVGKGLAVAAVVLGIAGPVLSLIANAATFG